METARIASACALRALAVAAVSFATPCRVAIAGEARIAPAELPAIGSIDERFQSFNIEMVEVTGGPFWKPYAREEQRSVSAEKNDLFSQRSPVDLSNKLLRKLASALSPAYLRVSGTWANTTFFAGPHGMPVRPPAGYKGVLTGDRWRDVIDFSNAVDAPIVTSFAIGPPTRDPKGVWRADQARQMILATRAAHGHIAAAEFMNEPDLPAIGGAPAGYGAAAFAADFGVFHAFMKKTAPDVLILGPGTASRNGDATELFLASASGIDAVSYHDYGALSERCATAPPADAALSEEWLSRTEQTLTFYRELRDRLAPGKPIWLTETAQAACGGDRWSSTFLDTFRYLDQLGRLARAGVQVVMHNTLVGSDYGLLDEESFRPRPNYWAALLWRHFMGVVVLDSGVPIEQGLHVYAHCQRRTPGGVVLLVINNDPQHAHELTLAIASARFTLDAATLQSGTVRLNGQLLDADAVDQFPRTSGTAASPGLTIFAPATVSFVAIPNAKNRNCT
jgi:Glycosyl hydrolase family 79, N-terminal domain